MKFFRDNSLKDHEEVIEQYFTTDVATNMSSGLGQGSQTIELIPGGTFVRVTDENKQEFIRKKCYYLAYKAVQE